MRRLAISSFIFAAAGLAGPILAWITWPPTKLAQSGLVINSTFVSDLLFLIWPTQPLAVMEVNTGRVVAAGAAVIANCLIFAMLGVLAGEMVGRRFGLLLLYLATGCLLTFLALWGAGFSSAYLNVGALALGLLLYGIPFLLTAILAK